MKKTVCLQGKVQVRVRVAGVCVCLCVHACECVCVNLGFPNGTPLVGKVGVPAAYPPARPSH